MKKLRITIEGKAYDVSVEVLQEAAGALPTAPLVRSTSTAGASVSLPSAAPAPSRPTEAGAGSVPSPLAGKIVSIEVSTGQAVKEGDELITMEAMKMNTHVFAPLSGTVTKILVNEGDAVEEGQILIELSA
ncbi:MAG: biotin/lipoyl-containing protein [Candidatus Methylacidiphilales bacterium]